MKKKALAMLLAVVIAVGLLPGTVFAAAVPTEQQAYEAMIALKSEYPEGMRWTNANTYVWYAYPQYSYATGRGCVAFAYMLSDAAFGTGKDFPARDVTGFEYSDVRVGDILRINNDTHSVIVLEVHDDGVVIAEGNFNSSIRWGRTLTKAQVMAADYMTTRWPEETEPSKPETPPTGPETPPTETGTPPAGPKVPSFPDVPDGAWYRDTVNAAVERGIITGNTDGTFNPDGKLKRIQTFTILARLDGKTIAGSAWEADAINWAVESGVSVDGSNPGGDITREQLAVMLWRYAGEPKADASVLDSFSDNSDIHDWAGFREAMAWAVGNGIIQGVTSSTLNPLGSATRAQAVTMIMRFIDPDTFAQ